MSSDVAEVEKVLQTYFDGLYEGDTGKLGAAFHPMSHLYSVGAVFLEYANFFIFAVTGHNKGVRCFLDCDCIHYSLIKLAAKSCHVNRLARFLKRNLHFPLEA